MTAHTHTQCLNLPIGVRVGVVAWPSIRSRSISTQYAFTGFVFDCGWTVTNRIGEEHLLVGEIKTQRYVLARHSLSLVNLEVDTALDMIQSRSS